MNLGDYIPQTEIVFYWKNANGIAETSEVNFNFLVNTLDICKYLDLHTIDGLVFDINNSTNGYPCYIVFYTYGVSKNYEDYVEFTTEHQYLLTQSLKSRFGERLKYEPK